MGDQDRRAVVERLWDAMQAGDPRGLAAALSESTTDDFIQEWPQSGERIRGREQSLRLFEAYPTESGTSPTMKLGRILGGGDIYVVEGTIDYGDGVPVSYVGITEFRDGRISKVTEYFANPFPAPAWRAGMVERMEPATV